MTLNDDYYTESEVLEFLGIAKATLKHRRSMGRNHPPFVRLGKKVVFPKKEFHAWLKSRPVHKAIA